MFSFNTSTHGRTHPDAPDPELTPPNLDGLEPDAQARAQRVYEFTIAELKMRKDVCLMLLV